MPIVVTEPRKWLGWSFNGGDCVRLLQIIAGCPHPSLWWRGVRVVGSGSLPGTCIATFDAAGRHAGSEHAAIYLDSFVGGIRILDQKLGRVVAEHALRCGAAHPHDDADAFYVIET